MSRKSYYWFFGALAVLGAYALGSWGGLAPSRAKAKQATEGAEGSRRSGPGAARSSASSDEVARLRAELKKKDEMVQSLVTVTALTGMGSGELGADRNAVPGSDGNAAEEKVRGLLDERIRMGNSDPRLAADLDRALRDVLALVPLGDTKVENLQCASSLCRVLFAAKAPGADNQAVAATLDKLPKTFGSTAAYRVDDKQTALYLGRSVDDITVEEPL